MNEPPETPSDPSPENGSTHLNLNLDLSWTSRDPEGGALTYDVYFGTDNNPPKVSANQSAKSYDLGELEYNTRYYWRIIAWDNDGGFTIGPLWEFNIGSKPSPEPPTSKQISSLPPQLGNIPPVADGSIGEPFLGVIGEELLFDASNSVDTDGFITNYTWDFGDVGRGYGVRTTYKFIDPGEYTVILTVTDDDGAQDIFETTVTISQPNRVPSAPIVDGPQVGTKNTEYNFTAISIDLDNDSIQYHFSWGDGTSNYTDFLSNGTVAVQMHKWAFAGVYTVVVQAFDNNILSNTTLLQILIDAIIIDNIGYFTDDDADGIYDTFHNESISSKLKKENGRYLIDVNDDGEWDYNFDLTDGLSSLEKKEGGFEAPWMIIILVIVIVLLFIICIFYIYKKRYF